MGHFYLPDVPKMKPTKNELKMKICLLTLYLKHFNENKFMFGRTLKKLFLIFLFRLWHSKVNLRTSTYVFSKFTAPANINSAAFGTFVKNLRSAARKFAYSADWGNTYIPPPHTPPPLPSLGNEHWCMRNRSKVINLLGSLGFVKHAEKPMFLQSQTI